jgi:hypothetical protein
MPIDLIIQLGRQMGFEEIQGYLFFFQGLLKELIKGLVDQSHL